MIDWESILPKKLSTSFLHEDDAAKAIHANEMRDNCLLVLRSAEARGEICKPLSVEEMLKLCGVYAESSIVKACLEKIHNAMVGKGSK